MSTGIRLGGFWPKQAQDGSWYLEGPFGNVTVRVYENKYKKTDKDPSHVMYLSEKPKPQNKPAPPQTQGGFSPRHQAVAQTQTQTAPPKNYAPQKTFVDHTKGGDTAEPGQWDPDDIPF